MTPKQKAKELVNKFHIKVIDREGTSAMNEFESKQCALIAVDEIIDATQQYSYAVGYGMMNHDTYWVEVKQEIEAL